MDLLSGQEAQKQKVPPVAWQIRSTQNFDKVALFSCSTVFSFGKNFSKPVIWWQHCAYGLVELCRHQHGWKCPDVLFEKVQRFQRRATPWGKDAAEVVWTFEREYYVSFYSGNYGTCRSDKLLDLSTTSWRPEPPGRNRVRQRGALIRPGLRAKWKNGTRAW